MNYLPLDLHVAICTYLSPEEVFRYTSISRKLFSIRKDQGFLTKLISSYWGYTFTFSLNIRDFLMIGYFDFCELPIATRGYYGDNQQYQYYHRDGVDDKTPLFIDFLFRKEFEAWNSRKKISTYRVDSFRFKALNYNWYHQKLYGVKVKTYSPEGALLLLAQKYPEEKILHNFILKYVCTIPFGNSKLFYTKDFDDKMGEKIIEKFLKGAKNFGITLTEIQ